MYLEFDLVRIKFGVDIVNANWNQEKENVMAFEKQGFDSVWVMDHFWWKRYNYNCLECWTTLSALASITKKIKIGTLVSCNLYRSPALLAKMAATLDVISNGRLNFGIGAGWDEAECTAYGIPFPSSINRVKRLREAIKIIKKMWTEDKATYIGQYYHIKDAICKPKPIQKPHPPIWIGGKGRLMLKLAAEEADGINFYGTPKEFKERYKILKNFCTNIGRDYNDIKKSWTGDVIMATDKDELDNKIRAYLRTHPEAKGKVDYYIRRNLTGTPEKIRSQIEEYVALGVEYFWPGIEPPRTFMTPEERQIFVDEVMKKVR